VKKAIANKGLLLDIVTHWQWLSLLSAVRQVIQTVEASLHLVFNSSFGPTDPKSKNFAFHV
jgi:hypothetical protein